MKSSENENALKKIDEYSQKLVSLGMTHNMHTTLTYEGNIASLHTTSYANFVDCVMQWEQYRDFLVQKKNSIEEQIFVTKYPWVITAAYTL